MTQDIKQQIEVMQHREAGGKVEVQEKGFNGPKYPMADNMEFNFCSNDYKIVGTSRAPFDPIQHMKDGGVCVAAYDTALWRIFYGVLQFKMKWGIKDWSRDAHTDSAFIGWLFNNELQPYQEPEKAVVWRCKDSNEEFCVDPNFSFTGNTSFTRELVAKFIEIAQGKWERVDD